MDVPGTSKCLYRSRGQRILALVPKLVIDSDPESDGGDDDDAENISDDEIQRRIDRLFTTIPEQFEEVTNLQDLDSFDDNENEHPSISLPDPSPDLDLISSEEVLPEAPKLPEGKPKRLRHRPSTPQLVPPPKKTARPKKQTTRRVKGGKVNKNKKTNFKWNRCNFLKVVTLPASKFSPKPEIPPVEYFMRFFTEELFDLIVYQTNLYSTKQSKGAGSANFTAQDIREFLAVQLRMGVVKMPDFRDYWSNEMRFEPAANIMPRNKYQKIRQYLHFANNEELPNSTDKYFKVRPVADYLRARFQEILPEKQFSVDEMMVAYKGRKAGGRKQYMKQKPTKWGFKIYTRSGISGIVYDFFLFEWDKSLRQVEFTPYEDKHFGFSGKCVLALAKTAKPIPGEPPNAIFFDNFFSSPLLMYHLRDNYGLMSIGTIRANRTDGAANVLKSDVTLKNEGRGTFDEVCDNEKAVTIVKWQDTKPVMIGSTYVGAEPTQQVDRWLKTVKKREKVVCPNIIIEYNKYMGGVDKSDMLVSLYKTPLRTYKWYMRLFAHFLDMAVNNSWLLYKRDNPLEKGKRFIPLKDFRARIATGLLNYKTPGKKKMKTTKKTPTAPILPKDCRSDQIGHFPGYVTKGRCRECHAGQTVIACMKCNARLCLVPHRNCCLKFHS